VEKWRWVFFEPREQWSPHPKAFTEGLLHGRLDLAECSQRAGVGLQVLTGCNEIVP